MILDLYNSPFDNFVQRTYQPQTPQNRLQIAYEQAMSRKTPEWARTVSDMMPSLAEIGAYFGTKGAFNQGRIADSLEREKQRRTAYNQMMRENEEKQAKDYIQQAKEQLAMAQADEDKAYNRELTANQIAYKKAQDELAQKNYEKEQEIKAQQRAEDVAFRNQQAEEERKQREIINQRNAENDAINRAYTKAQTNKMNMESNPEYIKQQQEQAQREAEDKQRQAQFKTYVDTAKDLFNKGYLSNEDLIAIEKNPELAEALIPKKRSWLGISIPYTKNPKKMKIDRDSFTIMKDTNGNMAKVYKDGRIEEL